MSQLQVTGEAKIRDIQGPVVANSGVITALDGAASQYVRGDGTLADFPTSTGGGSSVSYYLNSSVSQGTIGGVAYRELSKDPIIGAGTDITISANGYVANYITDANDPDVTIVPGGNFNCEFYFSVNNNTGNPTTYAELYKYDGTTFTLLGTSAGVPESINQGTTIAPYYFAIPVATAALSLTDRLAIRIYVNVDGRTVTLHTENSHLCQVVTTFSKGMVSLNNLTDQSQFITTGTSGTNFNIVSSGDTHTFNLPVASATNTGKLSNTDWSTFNAKQPAGNYVTLDTNQTITAEKTFSVSPISESGYSFKILASGTPFQNGYSLISSIEGSVSITQALSAGNLKAFTFDFSDWNINTTRTYTLPDISGTLALLEGTQTFSGDKLFNGSVDFNNSVDINSGLFIRNNVIGSTLYTSFTITKASSTQTLSYLFSTGFASNLLFNDAANYSYTFPTASGTIALTSNINYPVTSVFGRTGAVVSSSGDYTTTQVTEGTNLYFTDARARAALSATSPIFYNSTTGVISSQAASATLQGFVTTSSQTIAGVKTFSNGIVMDNGSSGVPLEFKQYASAGYSGTGFTSLFALNNSLCINFGNPSGFIILNTTTLTSNRTFTFQNASGTLALTSDLSAYLPLTGGTLTGALSGTSATLSSSLGVNSTIRSTGQTDPASGVGMELFYRAADTSSYIQSYDRTNGAWKDVRIYGNALYFGSQGTNNLTIASTGAATFSSSVTTNTGAYGAIGGFVVNYSGASASSRSWRMITEQAVFGDFDIQQSTTQTGSTYASRMYFSPSGNVGIGTTSPANRLTISNNGNAAVAFRINDTNANASFLSLNASDSDAAIIAGGTSAIPFDIYTGGSQRMRITSSGNVGIGTSSPATTLEVLGANVGEYLRVGGGTISARSLTFSSFDVSGLSGVGHRINVQNGSGQLVLAIGGSDRMVVANSGIFLQRPSSGATLLQLSGSSAYGDTSTINLCDGRSYIQSTILTTANGATDIRFGTYNDIAIAERMRITSNGTIGLNGSADVANVNDKFSLGYFNSNYGWLQTWSSTPLYLNKLGNAVYAGSVRLDTLSDERVKDNIQPIENALSKVLSITGKKFHLKDEDESKIRYGFIAQELEGVLDEFVIQTDITFKHKELVVENVKSIENWASSWAALLVEAMKEQQAQIESQDAKIEELKALIAAK